jgi:hypothetical protein
MASVTIGTRTYDSYSNVDDADAYLAADAVRAAAWALRNADAKARGLVTATRILQGLAWCGEAPSFTDTPGVVVDVTALLAADGLANPRVFQNPAGTLPKGVKTAQAGKASVEFFGLVGQAATPAMGLPEALWAMLKNAGLVGCTAAVTPNDGPFVSGISSGECDRYPYGGVFWDDDCRRGGC